ncbi:histidine kinase [Cohnella kolymensis]|uniref:histidine kinase n=1 Tax=Cohnella kolymensis TaxID=1590652 RepID=A0ABR5A220_9BACL|nr:histidine kinase [Cohnella kolymensis]KIL35085.1 histidine kinase [Cohnella kolymensis]
MNSIQKKILSLSAIVLFIMVIIWVILTYYNQQTQAQYNQILQRYLRMNEMTTISQQTVTSLNNYLQAPSVETINELNENKARAQEAKLEIAQLKNRDNSFTLSNYMNMVDSLLEATDLSLMFLEQKNNEAAVTRFEEASRISKYIGETTLTLIDKELKTYDEFYRGIIQQSAELKKLGFLILGFVSVILLLFTYWFSLSMTRPIQKLTFAAKELSRGRFDLQIDIPSNDEISYLAKTFDRMRININNLISEIQSKAQLERELQESRLLLKESQLRTLQSQINPHFLFNTLDTLSKKAYLEGSQQTSDLIVSVANLLRYNLRNMDKPVTLQDEMELLLQYIDIQKARFTDRLRFVQEVDESCLSVQIPSLTLQPIIENSVIHAVEPSEEGGTIIFRVYQKEDRIMVEIEDDGEGIPQDKVTQMVNDTAAVPAQGKGLSTGIGFSNVVRRLRLFYGYEDVIDIESKPGIGTKVILQLPQVKVVEQS